MIHFSVVTSRGMRLGTGKLEEGQASPHRLERENPSADKIVMSLAPGFEAIKEIGRYSGLPK